MCRTYFTLCNCIVALLEFVRESNHIFYIFSILFHLQSILKIFTSASNILNYKSHLIYICSNCCTIILNQSYCTTVPFSYFYTALHLTGHLCHIVTRGKVVGLDNQLSTVAARKATQCQISKFQLDFFTSRTTQDYSCETLRVRAYTCATYLFQSSNVSL